MTTPRQDEPSDELSRRLSRVLATAPAWEIPADFAARTALAASTLAAPKLAPFNSAAFSPAARFGRLATQGAFAMLLLSMLLFAVRSHTLSSVALVVEVLLALELAALSTWLSLRPRR